jgi:hypothetical protein
MSRMNFHDEVTPAQARVLYHIERIFGSLRRTEAHLGYIAKAREIALDVDRVLTWNKGQCAVALQLLEEHCAGRREFTFRDCTTGWRDFA